MDVNDELKLLWGGVGSGRGCQGGYEPSISYCKNAIKKRKRSGCGRGQGGCEGKFYLVLILKIMTEDKQNIELALQI